MTLIEEYFKISDEYEKIHGVNTVVLMEVGSFFEIYQVGDLGKAEEISGLLNMILTKKNKNVPEVTMKNPLMTGFPSVSFDKNISRINDFKKYSIVIVKQSGVAPNITRFVSEVISPGTQYQIKSKQNNYLANVYIEYYGSSLIGVGISVLDVTTGESDLMECISTTECADDPLNEINQMINRYDPSEVIISMIDFNKDSSEQMIHKIDEIIGTYKVDNYERSDYDLSLLNEIFCEVYRIESLATAIEFINLEHHQLCCNALVDSIRFIRKHNPNILKNLPLPKYKDNKKYLTLNNDSLIQLNIIDNKTVGDRRGSILDILDSTITAGGSRLLRSRITNPISVKDSLIDSYDELERFIEDENYKSVRSGIACVFDIERLLRKQAIGRLEPFEVLSIFNSIDSIRLMGKKESFVWISGFQQELDKANTICNYIDSIFKIEKLSQLYLINITENIFTKDNTEINDLEASLLTIDYEADKIFKSFKANCQVDSQLLYSEKDGFHISLTPTRFNSINKDLLSGFSINKTKARIKIINTELQNLSDKKISYTYKINLLVGQLFLDEILTMYNSFGEEIRSISKFISHIDVVSNNAFKAVNMNLFKPHIINEQDGDSFIDCIDLRHPIVEKLTTCEYIKNDISFQDNIYGKIIFGVNSTGKSTILKATGVSVVMAQSGMYVPCKMKFYPYQNLYTRISGGDDLFSNKSTFTIEMLELKSILEKSNKNSIVLADELSHGTETNSGVAILSATINHLSKKKATFIFTTHLHQITDIHSIINNPKITMQHLSVSINPIDGSIIYDRKLTSGAGSSVYGLLVAEGLGLSDDFLGEARSILEEVRNDQSKIDNLVANNRNRYNSGKINEPCQICSLSSCDTHHIKEQSEFRDGRYESDFKNIKTNLINVCKDCHSQIHLGIIYDIIYIQTTNGIKLQYKKL